MDRKKAYTRLSIALGVFFLYSLFWLGRFLLTAEDGLAVGWQFWVNHLFGLLGMAGLIVFITSKFKSSGLLRIFMCKEIITFPVNAFYEYNTFSNFEKYKDNPGVYISLFLTLLIVVSSVAGLWMLTRDRVLKLKHYMIGSESAVAEFSPVSGWLRLANYAIDLVLIYYTAFNYFEALGFWKFTHGGFYRNSYGSFPVFLPLLSLLFYYFILEGIFNTSAGKCATNTIIVNSSGQLPSVGQRLGRTLCRLIPFEAFSFLSKSRRGWHDTITDTYVAASINKYEEKEAEDELSGFLSNEELN